jgi:hypothetical protein
MKWNKQFEYPKSMRSLINDERHYEVGTEKLPSVTTILAATQSDEKRASLAKWKTRVGDVEADRIKNTAATRGTFMHSSFRTPFKRSRATRFERRGASGEEHGTNYY